MLSTKVNPVDPGAPKKLQPKWDQLVDDSLTQVDFYDDLMFPREDFLIEAGVGYPNERAMLFSMNKLLKTFHKNRNEEWKILLQDDGSRIVRLVTTEKKGKKEERKGNPKMSSTKETRPKIGNGLKKHDVRVSKNSSRVSSVGKATSPRTIERNTICQVTDRKRYSRSHPHQKKEPHRVESLPQLRANWENSEIRSRREAERRFRECGDFEPYTREELVKILLEKKQYFEWRKENEKKPNDGAVIEVVKRIDSVGDGFDSDSDSSTRSFRTRIVRFSKLKSQNNQSSMSSTEEMLMTDDDVTTHPTCSGQDEALDKEDQITGNKLWSELEKNVVFDINESGIVSAVDVSKEISTEEKKNGEAGSVVIKVENVMGAKPWKMGKQIWASMINRNTTKRTKVGILDRGQWKRDVFSFLMNTNTPKVKEGYCLKMQNETCNRLSIPKYGPFAMKSESVVHIKPINVPEIPRIAKNLPVLDKRDNFINRKPLNVSVNVQPNQQSKVQSKSQDLKIKHGGSMSRADLKKTSSGKTLSTRGKVKNSTSTAEVSDGVSSFRKSNHVLHTSPYAVKQEVRGDVSSRTRLELASRPEFNIRTLQGLHDRPQMFSTSVSAVKVDSSADKGYHVRRVMPPMVESTIESSSAVNRRKKMRDIDDENKRITARLNNIVCGSQRKQKISLSVRGTQREKLPLARILKRVVAK